MSTNNPTPSDTFVCIIYNTLLHTYTSYKTKHKLYQFIEVFETGDWIFGFPDRNAQWYVFWGGLRKSKLPEIK